MKTLRIATILAATLFFILGQATDALANNEGEKVLLEKSKVFTKKSIRKARR